MTTLRAAVLVGVASFGVFANSLGNGFAIDDGQIIESNPAVTQPDFGEALLGPYWPVAREGAGLYRPVVSTSFALQWQLFRGSPLGFHLVNVLAHAAVSVLVLLLLARLGPLAPAIAGALVFAVHPLHVEAVANVVGLSELLAAGFFLAACLLFMRGASADDGIGRVSVVGICALYFLALGSKESAVVLPGILLMLEVGRTPADRLVRQLRRTAPLYASLVAILGAYLLLRTSVLGTVAGEVAAPWLRGMANGERLLLALSLWPEFSRLLLFPLDLASDYAPDVVPIPTAVTASVVAGAVILSGLLALAGSALRRAPLLSIGVAWFLVSILTVSNLLFPAGLIMAERTLYLPSVGLAFAVAALVARAVPSAEIPWRTPALAVGLVVLTLLGARTVLRNPTWTDSYTVVNTLALEHPESYVAVRARAWSAAQGGQDEVAREAYEAALQLAPGLYGLLVEVAQFYGSRGGFERAEQLLADAVQLRPAAAEAYMLLSEYAIRQSRGRDGHRWALAGLAHAGPRRELFSLVSESYIMRGDLEAAARARRAALGQDPESRSDWSRLGELYEAMELPEAAAAARARAAADEG